MPMTNFFGFKCERYAFLRVTLAQLVVFWRRGCQISFVTPALQNE